jgi:hypothetical protein
MFTTPVSKVLIVDGPELTTKAKPTAFCRSFHQGMKMMVSFDNMW